MKTLKTFLRTALLLTLTLNIVKATTHENNTSFQTVRGRVYDQDSKTPIIGANVIILGISPILGASTNIDGDFRIEKVPVGRISLQITYLGYETKTIPNLVVGSGKEIVLNIEIAESIVKLDDITVTAQQKKSEALNEMATVSAKVFTVEETQRYAGTFNDPARMVTSFAGVTGDPEGNNDIVVRGNSPKGILWRLEGVEIPNPNHFAGEGESGGPINALNSAMLANSDFYSGAFAPEYGNAYSGVFDMKLRTGNNEKHEYSFSLGALGIDFTAEGPYNKSYNGSYLVNYRYSSLGILDDLGIVDFYGVPKYQDLCFKTVLPTKKIGTFSIFGLGGLSTIYQEAFADESENYVTRKADFEAGLGVIGINHTYTINYKSFFRTTLSGSGTKNASDYYIRDSLSNFYLAGKDHYYNTSIRISTCYNNKISARNRIKAGVEYTDLGYNFFSQSDLLGTGNQNIELDSKDRTGLLQAYMNWKYRITDNFTVVSGLHYMQLLLNNSSSIEPRLGFEWQARPGTSLTFGLGVHSKVESIAIYLVNVENDEGLIEQPNKNLGLSKSLHLVIGFRQQLTEQVYLKTEAYYQYLYNLAVEDDPNSPYVLNNLSGRWEQMTFVNEGTGRNYGIELTLERFFNHHYYFLVTGSIYDSKFTALDGIERNSAFNGKYAGNLILGKEFTIGDSEKHRTIGINGKMTLIGGSYYTPIDLEASIAENNDVYDMNQYLAVRKDDVFKLDFGISYRRDRPKTTHEFKIDIQNLTNNQAVVGQYYDNEKQAITNATQWSIFPNIIYTIHF